MPRYAWTELDATPEALSRAADAQGNVWDSSAGEWVPSTSCGRDLERAAANRERSARRAKTQVRRLIKAKNLDTMLTLTYRENMTDRARMARDFDVFMKRIRRIFPSFLSTSVSLRNKKRGAWHAHMAVQRVQSHYLHRGVLVKSYDLLRAVWRAVVGEGNVDISKARRHSQRNISKLASISRSTSPRPSMRVALGIATGQVERLCLSLS